MATRASSKFKATIVLSSDHAGIARELKGLQAEMYRVLGKLSQPRTVRDYVEGLRRHSRQWYEEVAEANGWK